MTTFPSGLVDLDIIGAPLRAINFDGTVKLGGTGVARAIMGYKVAQPETVFETVSDSYGHWALTMYGGSNDKFRIIAVGIDGENSEIYDHLIG